MTSPMAVATTAPTSEAEPRRHPPAGDEERGGVGAEPEERGVAERDLAGVAAGHVPGRRAGAPDQDQDEAVEQERVAHDERREPGQAEEHDARARSPLHVPSASAPRCPNSPAGRTTRMAMNSTR